MIRRLAILFLLAFSIRHVHAQMAERYWANYWEAWAEQHEQEALPDDLMETIASLHERPINLNDTLSRQLLALPFITNFQRETLIDYIRQNGPLYTVAELNLLNGFDSTTIQLLRPLVFAGPISPSPAPTGKELMKNSHSNLVIGTHRTAEASRAYTEEIYPGSPYRLYFRYYLSSSDHLHIQLSGDKDPGEEWFAGSQTQGFDHYGFHAMLNGMGALRRFIVGGYNLQMGQGLTLWTGFVPWTTSDADPCRYGQGIRPGGAMSENGYLNGTAATLQLGTYITLTPFASISNLDGTPSKIDSNAVQSLSSSGYHRTLNELKKKNLLNERILGANLNWNNNRLSWGITTYQSHYSKPLAPPDYIYNHFAFRGTDNWVTGLDASYLFRRLLCFGEMAISNNCNTKFSNTLPISWLAGLQFSANSFTQASLTFRHYAPSFQNLHASPLGQYSGCQNEDGTRMAFRSQLPQGLTLSTSADFFRSSLMRYGVYSPSSGWDYRIDLSQDLANHAQVALLYRNKSKGNNASLNGIDTLRNHTTPLEAEHSYIVEQQLRQQLQLRLTFTPSNTWDLSTRVMYCWFDCEYHTASKGFLILQDVVCHPENKPFSINAHYTLFDIADYNARLYTMESDLLYEFASPSLMGKGIRFYLVARWTPSPNLTLSAKYAITQYADSETIGTGYDQIPSSHCQEIKLQLRLKR